MILRECTSAAARLLAAAGAVGGSSVHPPALRVGAVCCVSDLFPSDPLAGVGPLAGVRGSILLLDLPVVEI